MSDALVFKSKADLWVLVVLLSIVAASLVGFAHIYVVVQRGVAEAAWPPLIGLLVLCLIGVGLPLWLLLSTRYRLTDENLDVRCGPIRRVILLSEIAGVSTVRDAGLGPALSQDRVKIQCETGRSITISPDNRQAFLRQLEARRRQAREAG